MEKYFHLFTVIVEAAALGILMLGLTLATLRFLYEVVRGRAHDAYTTCRHYIGRTLMLSLEFLIAADIIQSVAIEQTIDSLTKLGFLVVIRVLLSIALGLEVAGRGPWKGSEPES